MKAKEFLKRFSDELSKKDSHPIFVNREGKEYSLEQLLTLFGTLNHKMKRSKKECPQQQQNEIGVEEVKGFELKIGDVIWYGQEFNEIVIPEFRDMLKNTYPQDTFLRRTPIKGGNSFLPM